MHWEGVGLKDVRIVLLTQQPHLAVSNIPDTSGIFHLVELVCMPQGKAPGCTVWMFALSNLLES